MKNTPDNPNVIHQYASHNLEKAPTEGIVM